MRQKNMGRMFLLLFTLCLFLAKGYNLYNSDNADIIPVYQHMADPKNFSGEFYMDEMEKPSSSRFFISVGVAALMRMGLSVEVIMMALYILSFTFTAIGLWKLSIRFSQDNPVVFYTVTFSIYTLTEITFRLGSAGFKFSMPLPSTFAAGFCVLAYGLYFENKQQAARGFGKAIAFLLCGLATLIQAFVGLFFGGVLVLHVFYETFIQKTSIQKTRIISIIGGSLLFMIPVMLAFLSGMTGANNPLSPTEIVEILARFRQPHHNFPASWLMTAYLEFGIILVATVWMLKGSEKGQNKLLISLTTITGGVAVLSVFLNFIATSVLPLPFFSKLQSGRAFAPFILTVSLAWGMKASKLIQEKHYVYALSIWGMLIVPFGGILLFPFMLLTSKRTFVFHKLQTIGFVLVNAGSLLLAIFEPKSQPLDTYLWLVVISLLFLVIHILQSRVIGYESIASKSGLNKARSLLGISMLTFILLLFIKAPAFLNPAKPYPDMNVLADKFNALPIAKGLVLSDPGLSESLYFRFYSETGTVVSFKCFPHADDGIRDWYKRMETIGGVNLQGRKTSGIPFSQRTWEQLMNMAREYDASYLLAHKNWFPDAPVKPFVQHADWLIYQMD